MLTPAQQESLDAGSAQASAVFNLAHGTSPGVSNGSLVPTGFNGQQAGGPPAPTVINQVTGKPQPTQGIPTPGSTNDTVQGTPGGGYSIVPKDTTPPSEPTVLASGNIEDTVIPNNNDNLAAMSVKGGSTDGEGLLLNADGTYAQAPSGAVQNEDGSYTANGQTYGVGPDSTADPIMGMISSMKASLDASTATQISSIGSQYAQLRQLQQSINTTNSNGLSSSLLARGSTQGTPYDSAGIMGIALTQGLNLISKLDSDENAAVASAKAAQQSGDMSLMDKAITEAQNVRDEKQKAAQTLSANLSKATTAALKTKTDAQISSAVSDLYGQGVTDPSAILKALTDAGLSVTASDVASNLKALTPVTPKAANALKFTSAQLGKLYSSGLTTPQVQALSDYYNGTGDPAALSGLSTSQQAIVHDALNGLSTKAPTASSTGGAKPYTSGSYTYTSGDLGKISGWLTATKGSDGYVDPNAYQQAFDTWTALPPEGAGGLAKDFLKNFPAKTLINPANDWLPQYLKSKTTTSSSSSTSGGRSI